MRLSCVPCARVHQVSAGMGHLHDHVNLLHHDLKPENVLVTSGWVGKVGEFGAVTQFTTEEEPLVPMQQPDDILLSGVALFDENVDNDAAGLCGCFGAAKKKKKRPPPTPLEHSDSQSSAQLKSALKVSDPSPQEGPPAPAAKGVGLAPDAKAAAPAGATRPKLAKKASMKTSFLLASEEKQGQDVEEDEAAKSKETGSRPRLGRRKSHLDGLEGSDESAYALNRRKSVVERKRVGALSYLSPEAAIANSDPYADEPGMPADVRLHSRPHVASRCWRVANVCAVMCAPASRSLAGVVVWMRTRPHRHFHAAVRRRHPQWWQCCAGDGRSQE